MALKISTATLNITLLGDQSQWKLTGASEMWSKKRKLETSRAAAFMTDCIADGKGVLEE